jgi:hypothetical protein
MTIWKMPIDIRRGNSSYAEIKNRHVVAAGWSSLGDLSCLYQACRTGHFNWQEVVPILKYLLDLYFRLFFRAMLDLSQVATARGMLSPEWS